MARPATPEKTCPNCSLLHTRWGETCRERLMQEVRALRAQLAAAPPPSPPETPAPSPVESPGEERPMADLAEIERLVSKYGRAIVYGGNGLKALEARATLLSAIRSLRAPREVEEVVRAARQVIDANWIAHSPGTVGERLANALSRLSSSPETTTKEPSDG